MKEAKKFYMEELEKNYKEYKDFYAYLESEDFEKYLVLNNFLGLCDYREIHIGDYKFFNEDKWLEEFKESKNEIL